MTQQSQSQNQPHPSRQYHPVFKLTIFSLLIAGFLIYRLLFASSIISCINDAYQDATQGANRDFTADPSKGPVYQGNDNELSLTGKAMIGTGQVLMDLWVAIFAIVWLIKTKNVRALMAFGGFFIIRSGIFFIVESFPFPKDIVWKNPGFFSFTVPYEHTRDFFYSGHTGTLTVILCQMYSLNYRVLVVLNLLSLIFMVNLLLMTKVHYSIDIVGGLIFATFMHQLSTRTVYYTDKAASFPFWLAQKIYNKCKKPESSQPLAQIHQIEPGATEKNTEDDINSKLKK